MRTTPLMPYSVAINATLLIPHLVTSSPINTALINGYLVAALPPSRVAVVAPGPSAAVAARRPLVGPGTSGKGVLQGARYGLHVPEVAEAALRTLPHLKLPAGRLPEVPHGTQVHEDGPAPVPPVVQLLRSLYRVLLLVELDVHVAAQLFALVIADAHLLDLAVLLLALEEHILEEVIKVFLQLVLTEVPQMGAVSRLGRVVLRHVHLAYHDGLTVLWLVVFPGAALPMPARSRLDVEGAVHPVLLRAVDGG